MKLQQLRYAVEILRQNLNISEAAETLFTSQPGISKQIRLLEEELNTPIFIRNGKRIVSVTPAGKLILEIAQRILQDVQKIKHISRDFSGSNVGSLTLATTPNHLRYRLPDAVRNFRLQYPEVALHIRQGSPEELVQMVQTGEVDFAIGTEFDRNNAYLKLIPCLQWKYALLLPKKHYLCNKNHLQASDLVQYPLLAYHHAFQDNTPLKRAFASVSDQLHLALTADDDSVLQDYVRLGMGIALVDADFKLQDDELTLLSLDHFLMPSFTQLIFRSDALLRHCDYDFIQLFHPPFDREKLDRLLYAPAVEDFSI